MIEQLADLSNQLGKDEAKNKLRSDIKKCLDDLATTSFLLQQYSK